jgi:hypothetical protein
MLWMRSKLFLTLVVLALGVGAATGQGPNDVGLEQLIDDVRRPAVRDTWAKLTRGDAQASATDKDHMATIGYFAKFYTYRFVNKQFHTVGGTDARKTLAGLYSEFDKEVHNFINGKEKTRDLGFLFAREVARRGKEVLDADSLPMVQVNITRVLARTAVLGNPELADVLAVIVKDPNFSDGVKYWALRGLRDLMHLIPSNSAQFGKDREGKVASALIDFINRKVSIVPLITPQDEIDGLGVIRREAIRALAQVRSPSLSNKINPALTLLRIVANEELTPELRMDERMEAAIGLAHMRPGKDKDFQAAYAAQNIALLLVDFTKYYNDRETHRKPCRVYAAELADALDGLKAETKDPYVLGMFDNGKFGQKLLELMEKGEPRANGDSLLNEAEKKQPPVAQLFTSQPDSKVKAAKKD